MAFYFLRHRQKPLVVIASPKCACSSLKRWFVASHAVPAEHRFALHRCMIRPQDLEHLVDHERVFFLHDPLRRLVSFYARWVVQAPLGTPHRLLDSWCFADQQRRFFLHGKTFRQFLLVLRHLHASGLALQHHLQPQLQHVPREQIDRVILIENLEDGLDDLNRQFGFSHADAVPPRVNVTTYDLESDQSVMDRPPAWLARHGLPAPARFFDDETRALAEMVYSEDLGFYRSQPDARGL